MSWHFVLGVCGVLVWFGYFTVSSPPVPEEPPAISSLEPPSCARSWPGLAGSGPCHPMCATPSVRAVLSVRLATLSFILGGPRGRTPSSIIAHACDRLRSPASLLSRLPPYPPRRLLAQADGKGAARGPSPAETAPSSPFSLLPPRPTPREGAGDPWAAHPAGAALPGALSLVGRGGTPLP